MESTIETHQLSKHFSRPGGWRRIERLPPLTAVDDVSLQVQAGEFFGLLGPNGAGKTTLVKMLCTLILPSQGWAVVAGYPLTETQAIRANVGLVVSDERSFYWRLSGRDNLHFFAAMHGLYGTEGVTRTNEVLEAVDMSQVADVRFSGYSTGMKQRMAIARSLLHRPRVLFLDEPSRSLDPTATGRLHALLRRLKERDQITIFLITHDLDEAEKLCQRVAVMHRGRIQAVGSPADLRKKLGRQLQYTVRVGPLAEVVTEQCARLIPGYRLLEAGSQQHLQFKADESSQLLTTVLDLLRQHQVTIFSIEGVPPTLEEAFTYFTRDDSPLL